MAIQVMLFLYIQCFRYNICSAWFLDIRISTCFTKWLEAWAIPNQEAKTVAQKLLEEMFLCFSLPDRLHSDQGRQFEGKLIEELCKLLQVEKTHTTPYHPQEDGLVERANRTILNMLATVVKDHKV